MPDRNLSWFRSATVNLSFQIFTQVRFDKSGKHWFNFVSSRWEISQRGCWLLGNGVLFPLQFSAPFVWHVLFTSISRLNSSGNFQDFKHTLMKIYCFHYYLFISLKRYTGLSRIFFVISRSFSTILALYGFNVSFISEWKI